MTKNKDVSIESSFEDRLQYVLDGQSVITVEEEARIVRAVNAHEELLGLVNNYHDFIHEKSQIPCGSLCHIRQAIAKAEGTDVHPSDGR